MSSTSRDPRTGDREIHGIVFDEDTIQARVRELGEEITTAYTTEKDVVVLGLLKGSVLFLADLVRHIGVPLQVDFLVAASYGDATTSSGDVRLLYEPKIDLEGKTVLVVEDIIDTGATLAEILPRLRARGPSRLDLCALLHKRLPSVEVEARWVGFDAPKAFLVGYGLDHAEHFRHLPYIASL